MGDQKVQPLGVRRGIRGDLQAVRAAGAVANQDLVEASLLMRPRKRADECAIDDRARARMDLRLLLGGNHADEFDGHPTVPFYLFVRLVRF